MRNLHITYMRNLAAAISVGGSTPFGSNNFYELAPPLQFFEHLTPFVSVRYKGVGPLVEGTIYKNIQNGVQSGGALDGKVTQRFLRREYNQLFSYSMDFWIDDPSFDIFSDPLPVDSDGLASSSMNPGILDQALLYIANNRIVTLDPVRVIATAGSHGLVTDPGDGISVYQLTLNIDFSDGLYALEEVSTLDGATFQAVDPVVG